MITNCKKGSGGSGGDMTPEEIKIAYESNPNTNAFTDTEKSKLALAISNEIGRASCRERVCMFV